jgi:hypothetical protein
MMTDQETPSASTWPRRQLFRLLSGGVAGLVAGLAMTSLIDSPLVGGLGKSETIAALVGVTYGLMGVGILLGSANPRIGATYLNVEDADELREQQRMFLYSGLSALLWGVALVALAFAAPGGPLLQGAALAVAAAGLLIGTAVSIPVYRAADELMRAVTIEGGAISSWLLFAVITPWAMLAHLGYASGPQPIDLISLFYGLMLVGSFFVIFRRGMVRGG